jgi:uncharacterized membrane protein
MVVQSSTSSPKKAYCSPVEVSQKKLSVIDNTFSLVTVACILVRLSLALDIDTTVPICSCGAIVLIVYIHIEGKKYGFVYLKKKDGAILVCFMHSSGTLLVTHLSTGERFYNRHIVY